MNQGVIKFPITVERVFDSPYQKTLEKGDIIRSINGIRIDKDLIDEGDLFGNNVSDKEFTYVVERNGGIVTLEGVIQNPPRIVLSARGRGLAW